MSAEKWGAPIEIPPAPSLPMRCPRCDGYVALRPPLPLRPRCPKGHEIGVSK